MLNGLLPIVCGLLFVVLAVIVLTSGNVGRYKGYFSLFLLSGAVWSIAVGIFLVTTDGGLARAMVAVFYVAALVIAYATLMFARTPPEHGTRSRHSHLLPEVVTAVPVIAAAVMIALPDVFFTGVSADGRHNSYTLVPLPYVAYVLLFIAYVLVAIRLLYRRYVGSVHRAADRQGLRLISVSIAVGLGFGAFFNLILPLFTVNEYIWIGPLAIIPLAVIISYAIVKRGLFDIRLIVVRTLGYVLSILTLGVIYVGLAYVVSFVFLQNNLSPGIEMSPMNVVFALVLAFVFQPVKRFFDRVTDSIFYRNRYDVEEFIALLSNILSSTSELRDLLAKASDVISMTMKSHQVFFVVRNGDAYVTGGTPNHSAFSHGEILNLQSMAAGFRGEVVVTEQLPPRSDAARILARSKVALLLPLWHEGQVIGCLCLGDALGSPYSKRDLQTLETISDELVIAIENALSLDTVRDTNAHLQQKIDTATVSLRRSNNKLRRLDDSKDEFISMASHQLRTPLTSVKGYISMILDGDAGEVNETQRRFLTEAFESSNRMAGIIGDFLNVSRLQTGKFTLEREPVDLGDVVESEVQHLRNTAGIRGVTLKYHKPAHFPTAALDKSKVEQVVMNFIDNAIFYAPETGDVDIELFQRAGRAVFTVRDHGIGVPKAEQGSLFTKFFRATNARRKRPDGTGVGLFLAKKVVTAHGGAIIFESHEGKGSTFGFEIPLR